jgi:hypothetical protein
MDSLTRSVRSFRRILAHGQDDRHGDEDADTGNRHGRTTVSVTVTPVVEANSETGDAFQEHHKKPWALFSRSSLRRSRSGGATTSSPQVPKLPLLYALAKSWAWEAVSFRCQTHPEEASEIYVDEYNLDNILHWMLIGKPPIAPIRAVLSTNPILAQCRNRRGLLPLHGTCVDRTIRQVILDVLTTC